jgi:two-component system, chemotaxis family, chemotaxis protein CheY
MNILIVEDDSVSATLLKAVLAPFGECHVAVTGIAAVDLMRKALSGDRPYHLVCLDIMLPGMDGQDVLKQIRFLEEQKGVLGLDGVKIVMITALGDSRSIMESFRSQCEGYIVKPIRKDKVVAVLRMLGFAHQVNAPPRRSPEEGLVRSQP